MDSVMCVTTAYCLSMVILLYIGCGSFTPQNIFAGQNTGFAGQNAGFAGQNAGFAGQNFRKIYKEEIPQNLSDDEGRPTFKLNLNRTKFIWGKQKMNLDVDIDNIQTIKINIRKRGKYRSCFATIPIKFVDRQNLNDKDKIIIAFIEKAQQPLD